MSERKTAKEWVREYKVRNRLSLLEHYFESAMLQARKEALEEASKLVRIHGTFGFFTRTDEIMKLLDKKSIDDPK